VLGVNLRVVSFDRLAFLATALALLARGELGRLFPARFSRLEKAYLCFILMFLFEAVLKFPPRDAFSVWTNTFDCYIFPFYLYLFTKYLLNRGGKYNDHLEGQISQVLAIVGLYCASMGIFEGITAIDLLPGPGENGLRVTEDGILRANGPFWVPGILGQYLSWILLLTLYRWRVRRLGDPASRPLRKLVAVPYTLLLSAGVYFVM